MCTRHLSTCDQYWLIKIRKKYTEMSIFPRIKIKSKEEKTEIRQQIVIKTCYIKTNNFNFMPDCLLAWLSYKWEKHMAKGCKYLLRKLSVLGWELSYEMRTSHAHILLFSLSGTSVWIWTKQNRQLSVLIFFVLRRCHRGLKSVCELPFLLKCISTLFVG